MREAPRSKSFASCSTRLASIEVLLPFLPRRPRSSRICSASWRRRPLTRRMDERSTSWTTCSQDWLSSSWRRGSSSDPSASSRSSMRLALSRSLRPSMRAVSASRAETGNTRDASMPSCAAVVWRCDSICRSTARRDSSGSDSVSILLSATRRVSAGLHRCSRQTARSDFVTPVSAPRMKTTACAEGSSDKVSSGSAPMALSPGVSSTTRPRRSSGWG